MLMFCREPNVSAKCRYGVALDAVEKRSSIVNIRHISKKLEEEIKRIYGAW